MLFNNLFEVILLNILLFYIIRKDSLKIPIIFGFLLRVLAAILLVNFFGYQGFLKDDISYLIKGIKLGDAWLSGVYPSLFRIAGGGNIIYYIYNAVTTIIFGKSYLSPVFLNCFLSVLSAFYFYKFLIIFNEKKLL